MIGYNIEEINTLIQNLKDSYAKLGETMASGWPTVQSTLKTEWVGPDEYSFEGVLAEKICNLYYACQYSIQDMITNIRNIGMTWENFQKGNVIQGMGQAVFTGRMVEFKNSDLETYNITQAVHSEEPQFTFSTTYGITNGVESANIINKAITNYVSRVYEEVKIMYGQIDTSKAFLGASQETTINEYLGRISTAVARLTTCLDDMRQSLATLVNAYNEQAQGINKSVANVDSNISFQNEISKDAPVNAGPVRMDHIQ